MKVLLSVNNYCEGKINWMSINDSGNPTICYGYDYGYGVDTVTAVENGFGAVSR